MLYLLNSFLSLFGYKNITSWRGSGATCMWDINHPKGQELVLVTHCAYFAHVMQNMVLVITGNHFVYPSSFPAIRMCMYKLPFGFNDFGLPNSSSFRNGKYIIPGDPKKARSPKDSQESANLSGTSFPQKIASWLILLMVQKSQGQPVWM